jgi:hypothetical protein
MQPCSVSAVGIGKTGSIIAALWTVITSIFVKVSNQEIGSIIMLSTGWFLIFFVTIIIAFLWSKKEKGVEHQ